ncbi:MAG: inositol polyphosphate kinase family protein [Oligoflexales bacterium]|nr:inositol polyphosphate kinase family protein [Oligoflexales bacterium]
MKQMSHVAVFMIVLFLSDSPRLKAANMEINRRSLKAYLSELGIEQKKLPRCEFQEENLCQNKGSGGHSATIFSTKGGYCAKKIHSHYTVKEIEFYLIAQEYCRLNGDRNSICNFLPEYAGLCKDKKQIYLQMENLKDFKDKRNSDVWALDLKVGRKTASLKSMKRSNTGLFQQFFWIGLHYFQDRYFTTSNDYGFRFAGLSSGSGSIEPGGFLQKMEYFRSPRKVISQFLDEGKFPHIVDCFSDKLKELYFALGDQDIHRFQLIGSSLLFVYNHNETSLSSRGCRLHMIDFANSFLIGGHEADMLESNMKHVLGYRQGVENLLVEFSDYYLLHTEK